MTAKKVKAPPVPSWDSLQRISKGGWDGVPDGPSPFYFGAKDGLFLHKRTLLGRGVAQMSHWPNNYPEFGSKGDFIWEVDPIPANLMGQVVSFFERIYDYQHTEAAVLLIMHQDTKEWRIFIPTQLVSHGGVNYVFDPDHIKLPWILVGSIHSHCDFGAGHSSTDTGDADGFEGFHCTIGHIKNAEPQIVAMIATNKKLLHFQKEDFPALFDFSEAKKHEAPKWWDRYVEDTKTKTKPVGFELFKKFNQPTIVKTEQPKSQLKQIGPGSGYQPVQHATSCRCSACVRDERWGTNNYQSGNVVRYNPQDWEWSESEKRMVKKGSIPATSQASSGKGYYNSRNVTPSREQRQLGDLARLIGIDDGPMTDTELEAMGFAWNAEKGVWIAGVGPSTIAISGEAPSGGKDKLFAEREGRRPRYSDLDEFNLYQTLYWEDEIPFSAELKTLILSSNLMTEEDIETMIAQPRLASDERFWKDMFFDKAMDAIDMLQNLGVDAKLSLRMPPDSLTSMAQPQAEPTNEKGQEQHGVR